MKRARWSFYRESDGRFISKRISTSHRSAVERAKPEGCVAIEGQYDRFMQRVDLETGEIVDDESLGAQRGRQRRIDATKLQLRELEMRQHRRVRELLAANDPQLARLEEEAAALRARLSEIDDETDTSAVGRQRT